MSNQEFDQIWLYIQRITVWSGPLNTQKLQKRHYFAYLIWFITIPLMVLQCIYTTFFEDTLLITSLYAGCNLSLAIYLVNSLIDSYLRREDFFDILNWCKSKHDLRIEGFNNIIQKRLHSTFENALRLTKFISTFIPVDCLLVTTGPIIPTLLYATHWRPPTEGVLPCYPSNGIISYLINSIIPILATLQLTLCLGVSFSIVGVTVLYINFQYSLMTEILRVLSVRNCNDFKKWYQLIVWLNNDISK